MPTQPTATQDRTTLSVNKEDHDRFRIAVALRGDRSMASAFSKAADLYIEPVKAEVDKASRRLAKTDS